MRKDPWERVKRLLPGLFFVIGAFVLLYTGYPIESLICIVLAKQVSLHDDIKLLEEKIDQGGPQ
jgi:hypothetical protein